MYFVKSIEHPLEIEGLIKLNLDTFSDLRGDIWTLHTDCDFLPDFVEDKISISKKNVLRGLHGDSLTDKLITCIHGDLQLVIVDLRENSPTYMNQLSYRLSEDEPISIFVPKGCVNAHLCLSERCIFYYKWSKKYCGAENQVTIKYDDEKLAIKWLSDSPILSDRDKKGIKSEGVKL